MTREAPVTAVEAGVMRRRWRPADAALCAAAGRLPGRLIGSVLAVSLLWQVSQRSHAALPRLVEHFKYGSIGAEPDERNALLRSGSALPTLFPDEFEGRNDYSAFGFLYENDDRGRQRDLPIGVSRRVVRGVEVVWLNCATCHTGT